MAAQTLQGFIAIVNCGSLTSFSLQQVAAMATDPAQLYNGSYAFAVTGNHALPNFGPLGGTPADYIRSVQRVPNVRAALAGRGHTPSAAAPA